MSSAAPSHFTALLRVSEPIVVLVSDPFNAYDHRAVFEEQRMVVASCSISRNVSGSMGRSPGRLDSLLSTQLPEKSRSDWAAWVGFQTKKMAAMKPTTMRLISRPC